MRLIWAEHPELGARLTEMWQRGLKVSEVAQAMGLTKDQVFGRAYRIGLALRPSPIKSHVTGQPRPKPIPAPPNSQCLWIEGEPTGKPFDKLICGKPVIGFGKPWCAEHHARAWQRRSAA